MYKCKETTLEIELHEMQFYQCDINFLQPTTHFHKTLVIDFYKKIAQKWGWNSKLSWSYEQWSKHLLDPSVVFHLLTQSKNFIGFYEFDIFPKNIGKIKYVALLDEYIGHGYSKNIISMIKMLAFKNGVSKLFTQTRNTDHPNAIKMYINAGFVISKEEEIYVEN